MKKCLLGLSIFLGSLDLSAQVQPGASRWSFSVMAGPAFPTGRFAANRAPTVWPVMVHTGFSAELAGAYRLCRSFSAALVLNGQENHGDALIYSPNPSGNNLVPGGFPDHYWKIGRVLGGAVYALPLQKVGGPDLLVRLLGGAERTRTADFEGYATFANPLSAGEKKATSPGSVLPWTFSYEADAGLQWKFRGGLDLAGYAGYNGGNPSWQGIRLSTSTITLRAGIIYHIEKRSP